MDTPQTISPLMFAAILGLIVFLLVAAAHLLSGDWVLRGWGKRDQTEEDMKLKPIGQVVKCRATYYGEAYAGKRMANGQRFEPGAFTCATHLWPLGAKLKVTHVEREFGMPERRSVVWVRVTDRGPNVSVSKGRRIDLSMAAFAAISPLSRGVIDVEVVEVEGGDR